ncbi:MAG: YidB family protein [Xanthobacteraceae bacterium]
MDELNLGGALKGALGQIEAEAAPAMINALLAKTQFGDLKGLVSQLQQGGLGTQVQSWLGSGANAPITADQLKAVLGNAQVQEMARHLGLPVDAALNMLAQHLPNVVDQASKNGQL